MPCSHLALRPQQLPTETPSSRTTTPCGGVAWPPTRGGGPTKQRRAQMLNVPFLLCTFGRWMSTSPGSTVSHDTVYAETHFWSRRMRLSVTLRFSTESLECPKP